MVAHPWRYQVTHEVVRQLFFFTSRREVNARGVVPRWVSAGVAEAFATGVGGQVGFTTYDPESPDRARFQLHALADKPFSLTRTINVAQLDFEALQDQSLRYAQCYTLFHFLMYGGDEERRTAFLDYMREAYLGKATPSRFKKIMGGDLDALEEEWTAYVKRVAGV